MEPSPPGSSPTDGFGQDGDLDALGVLGITVFAAFSGVRLKEVRLANKSDFSPQHWEMTVCHPKGEGAYASPRKARVAVPGRSSVQDFLDLREKAMKRAGITGGRDVPLVPFIRVKGGVSHWNDAYLHKVKVGVTARAAVRHDFRSLRRSFGQSALDRGARYDSVSVLLGHKSTRTTETYYARRRYTDAAEELERVWLPDRACHEGGTDLPSDLTRAKGRDPMADGIGSVFTVKYIGRGRS